LIVRPSHQVKKSTVHFEAMSDGENSGHLHNAFFRAILFVARQKDDVFAGAGTGTCLRTRPYLLLERSMATTTTV